jgi:hypothetical protein
MRSCSSVKRKRCPTEQNTHDAGLCQQLPFLHDGRGDERTARDDSSHRKLAAERSLDPHTILNEDKRIAMVKQGT